jgi:thioredoxin 1
MENDGPITHADSQTFDEQVLRSELPVLVDFWAPWCGPCHTVAPVVEELSRKYTGRVKFVKVNVDEAMDVASSIGIMNIPTLVLFNGGKAVARTVGVQPRAALEKLVLDELQDL